MKDLNEITIPEHKVLMKDGEFPTMALELIDGEIILEKNGKILYVPVPV